MKTSRSIAVIVDRARARQGGGALPAYAAGYISEILGHAGMPFDAMGPAALDGDLGGRAVIVLAQDLDLTAAQRSALDRFVAGGGALIGIGGTSGLDALFGCRVDGPLEEGYLLAPPAPHPITGGIRRDVHIYGGVRLTATTGTELAHVEATGGAIGVGVVERESGRGRTVLFGPDLITSVVHIQQGKPVVPTPPRDNSGVTAGLILDPERDRDEIAIDDVDMLYYSAPPHAPDGRPLYERRIFLEPMADALRELLLRAIFHCCRAAGVALPLLWYWPRSLPAVAHMSHDTDGNRLGLGYSLMYLLDELGVRTTWCTMPVTGYDRAFYDTLMEKGYEIALHYATGNAPVRTDRRWSKTDFDWQYDTLVYETRVPELVSNKNHGLAWQGRLDFYYWCQAKGIQIDQTRGDRGFSFGSSHVWFPMEDDRPDGAFLDVLAFPFLTQDLTVVCPLGFMRPLADRCLAAHGVAHYLFHPSHIEDPLCDRAIREVVAYTRSLGMEWWTSRDVNAWERARRRFAFAPNGNGRSFQLEAPTALPEATLMSLLPDGQQSATLTLDGRPLQTRVVERYGHRFAESVANLEGSSTLGVG